MGQPAVCQFVFEDVLRRFRFAYAPFFCVVSQSLDRLNAAIVRRQFPILGYGFFTPDGHPSAL